MFEKPFKRLIPVAACVAGLLALTGCADNGNVDLNKNVMQEVIIGPGTINEGANFRFDPARLEDSSDGASNQCAELAKTMIFTVMKAYVANGETGDTNGNWYGVRLAELPAQERASCANDTDGVVWINHVNVHTPASVTSIKISH